MEAILIPWKPEQTGIDRIEELVAENIALKAELNLVRDAVIRKCRQYEADMKTMQDALNKEIKARQAPGAQVMIFNQYTAGILLGAVVSMTLLSVIAVVTDTLSCR